MAETKTQHLFVESLEKLKELEADLDTVNYHGTEEEFNQLWDEYCIEVTRCIELAQMHWREKGYNINTHTFRR